jgi:purine-binding chemotaxis protein CheW
VTTETGIRQSNEASRQYLTFALAGEEYGVDILRVQEIRGWEPVTRVPNTPRCVRGVLNLRGAIVPVLDLRQRFGLPEQPCGPDTVVIVLRSQLAGAERSVGIVVDAVSDVLSAGGDEVRPPPDFGPRVPTEDLCGLFAVGSKMITVIDADRVVRVDEDDRAARP